MIDICSRRVVGWSIADNIRTELVTDAIEMAARTRGRDLRGVIFHSGRGSHYLPSGVKTSSVRRVAST